MFTGFTDETVDFMWGIRFNNERAWFEAHKEIYLTHFYQPMRELGDELYDYIAAKRPDLGLIRKVTRIYRDVRRLHGRGPYKESLWFSIEQPSEEWTATTGFNLYAVVESYFTDLDKRREINRLLHLEQNICEEVEEELGVYEM